MNAGKSGCTPKIWKAGESVPALISEKQPIHGRSFLLIYKTRCVAGPGPQTQREYNMEAFWGGLFVFPQKNCQVPSKFVC